MKNDVTKIKWLAGTIMMAVIVVLVLGSKAAYADTSIMKLGNYGTDSLSFVQHVVIKDINGGYVTRIYHTDIFGKSKLVNTSYMFKGDELTPSEYRLSLIAADAALVKHMKLMTKATLDRLK